MISRLSTWIAAGIAIGAVLGLADSLVLLIRARFMFLHTQELFLTVLLTFGLTIGSSTLFSAALCVVGHGIHKGLDRGSFFRQQKVRLTLFVAGLFLPAYFVLLQLTSGPQASQMPLRNLVVPGASLLVSLFGVYSLKQLHKWSRGSSRRRLVALSGTGAALILYYIDLTVLVRLYPVFHYTLTVLCFFLGGIGIGIGVAPIKNIFQPKVIVVSIFFAALLGSASAAALLRSQNPRYVVMEKTAVAGDILGVVSSLLPGKTPTTSKESAFEENEPSFLPSGDLIRPGANVMLISVDAMRFDRLAIFGGRKEIAPNINALVPESVVFKKAYTAIPHTSHAICSLMTGKFTHQLRNIPGVPPAHETWAEIMHRFRYQTAGFFSRAIFFIDRSQFEPYIRTSYGFQHRVIEYNVPAEKRAESLLDYLESIRGQSAPFFAWTHFFDPHEPYDESCTTFGEAPENRYDCEIANVDRAIGKIVKYLDHTYPNTIIIVTADHGEEFGDHGGRYHGTTLYDEQVRVPLLVRIPNHPHREVETPVSLVDIPGTILSILDIPAPARMRSRNLAGLMGGNEGDLDAFADLHGTIMTVSGDHKLIWDFQSDLARLYDLKHDQKETRSIADANPALVQQLKQKISNWLKSHAHHELRPIAKPSGDRSWPAAIRNALGGDESAAPELAALVRNNNEPLIRQKSARLLYEMHFNSGDIRLPEVEGETDPVVAGWLLLLHMTADETWTGNAVFHRVTTSLTPLADPWRELVILGAHRGLNRPIRHLLSIAEDNTASVNQRKSAISLLGETALGSKHRWVVPRLLELINEYQLTLEIAAALSRLGDLRATPVLIKRLKRERFLERKAEIIESLVALGGPGTLRAVADELLLQRPPTPILPALLALGKPSHSGIKITLSDKKTVVYLVAPRKLTPVKPRLSEISRVLIGTDGRADGGTITVLCNGNAVGSVPLAAGRQEGFIDPASCDVAGNARPQLEFQVPQDHLGSSIYAVAIVGKK